MKKCPICNNEFKERGTGTKYEKKYCSHRCGSIFVSRERYLEGKKLSLRETNPELYKELLKENYIKNKGRWHSRIITNKTIKELKNISKLLPKICKVCNAPENLEIHHEIYPLKIVEIIDAILENKIYYLCISCHSKLKEVVIEEKII